MTISHLNFVDYEIPMNFQPIEKRDNIQKKISRIGRKVFDYLMQNQYALAVSVFSYLIIETYANTPISDSIENLMDCQDRICQYWNNSIETRHNFVLNMNFRCNSSHPRYKPFKTFDQCMDNLCEYVAISGKNLSECFHYSNDIISLWNKFCPKRIFNKLTRDKKKKFLEGCLKSLCRHYAVNNHQHKFYSLCYSTELDKHMKKNFQTIKKWNTTEAITASGSSKEHILSITASTIGIVSAVTSIVASIIGCYVAKVTINSITQSLPAVSRGLKSIVDGTLSCMRRVSMAPDMLLQVPTAGSYMSEFSSNLESIYQEVRSHLSDIEGEFEEYLTAAEDTDVAETDV